MYVYLKFGIDPSVVKVISNVTIDENCSPVVDGQTILSTDSSTSRNIEAISWFKSLPMQAVYIDCSSRDARWCPKCVSVRIPQTPENVEQDTVRMRRKHVQPSHNSHAAADGPEQPTELPFMPDLARPLFQEHPGLADFNPLTDEMFERLESLHSQWEQVSEKGQINNEIAKILHCYIFPAVTFLMEDLPILQESLRLARVKQQAIEKEITDREKSIELSEKFIARQKATLFANEAITSESYLRACDLDFVDRLYVNVIKDIEDQNMKLDILQMRVNDQKKKGKTTEKLSSERDAVYDSMQTLLAVREAIRNYRFRPCTAKKKRNGKYDMSNSDVSLHASFKAACEHMVELKDHLKKLCYRKLHAVSIREAIESTIQSLAQKNPQSQGDFAEFSILINNDDSKKTPWKSMQVKVDEWLSTNNSLSQAHTSGCQLIKDLAQGMLSDSQMASWTQNMDCVDLKVDWDETSQDGKEESGFNGSCGSPFSTVLNVPLTSAQGSEEDISSHRTPMVQVIREQALHHMWDMAEKIVSRMKLGAAPNSRQVNRAWVCYGPHFWKEVGESIEKVYTHFQAPHAQRIFSHVASAALADIMDSTFFEQLCMKGQFRSSDSADDSASVVSLESQDSMSSLSVDLQRFSVSDLYMLANKDGAKLSTQMGKLDICVEQASDDSSSTNASQESLDTIKEDDGMAVTARSHGDVQTTKTSLSSSNLDNPVSDSLPSIEDISVVDVQRSKSDTISSSHTVSSVVGLFDCIVKPYHEKVCEVFEAQDIIEKMRAVWKSVDFLSKKTGEVCHARGMDNLLPMSIFATASFPKELFVKYFIQLLILLDFKPSFALHCVFDFSLTNAFSTYMFLFEAKPTSGSRDSSS